MMNSNTSDLSSLISIENSYRDEWDYNNLGIVLERLNEFEAVAGPSPQSADLRGHVLNRRGEWFEAYHSLNDALNRFPDNIDICYWAALNAIDTGLYVAASNLLDRLSDRLDDLPERMLRGIWRGAGVVGNLQLASAAFAQAKRQGSELALAAVGRRIEGALQTQSMRLAPIISVGENCQPWMLPNRWGLRRQDNIESQSSMFNLGQSSCYGVAKTIENLGHGLVSTDHLGVRKYPVGAPRPFNAGFHYEFNHELGNHWIINDFENLRSRYSSRIDNFKTYLAGEKRVFFYYSDRDGDINDVISAIIKVNADRNFTIVVIDLFENDRPRSLQHHDCVSYARLRFPNKDYVWWKPDHHDSDVGVYFERVIRNQLIDAAII